MNHRKEKIESILTKLVGTFLNQEAGPVSLITVTGISFNEKTNRAAVFISVLPAEKEQAALDFAKRRSSDLREFIKTQVKIRAIPVFDFIGDIGEKNRQLVDDISNNVAQADNSSNKA